MTKYRYRLTLEFITGKKIPANTTAKHLLDGSFLYSNEFIGAVTKSRITLRNKRID